MTEPLRSNLLAVRHELAVRLTMIVVGFLAFAFIATANSCDADFVRSTESANCVEFWFWRYQSLTAGLLALLAAGITGYFIKKQVTQNEIQTAIISFDQLTKHCNELRAHSIALGLATKYIDGLKDTASGLIKLVDNDVLDTTEAYMSLIEENMKPNFDFTGLMQGTVIEDVDVNIHVKRMEFWNFVSYIMEEQSNIEHNILMVKAAKAVGEGYNVAIGDKVIDCVRNIYFFCTRAVVSANELSKSVGEAHERRVSLLKHIERRLNFGTADQT